MMSRTLQETAIAQSTPTHGDNDCLRPVTWSDAAVISVTSSLCSDVTMTSGPAMGVAEWNWRVLPLVALVAVAISQAISQSVSVIAELFLG